MRIHFHGLDTMPCPYIPGLTARMERMFVEEITAEELESLLAAGYRHFGRYFFRPGCPGCGRCLPIRVRLDSYTPTRSALRSLRRTDRFRIDIGSPKPTEEAFDLYRLHLQRFGEPCAVDYPEFTRSFYHPSPFSRQMTMFDGDSLICSALFDITPQCVSAVYTFYDDTYRRESPGAAVLYRQIDLARSEGLQWVYLGYWVPENRHMSYKSRFRPNQLLVDGLGWTDYILPDGREAFSQRQAAFNAEQYHTLEETCPTDQYI